MYAIRSYYADGTVAWLGRDISKAGRKEMDGLRDDLQIVFQDPLASLDPVITSYSIHYTKLYELQFGEAIAATHEAPMARALKISPRWVASLEIS